MLWLFLYLAETSICEEMVNKMAVSKLLNIVDIFMRGRSLLGASMTYLKSIVNGLWGDSDLDSSLVFVTIIRDKTEAPAFSPNTGYCVKS